MKKLFISAILFIVIVNQFGPTVFASSYVLPYPSYMPGSKLYRISRFIDTISRYWYWGNLSQVKYHQKLSDKYLVESKVLFDYGQYLLASDALRRSGLEIQLVYPYIEKAKSNGIDTNIYTNLYHNQLRKHCQELSKIASAVPPTIVWQPENSAPVTLELRTQIIASKSIRSCNIYEEK